jgi:hypothetical protein
MCPEASRTSLQVTYETRYLQMGNEKCLDERPDKVPEWHKKTGLLRPRLAASAFHNSPYIFQPQPENARSGQSPFSLGLKVNKNITFSDGPVRNSEERIP